MFVKIGQDHNHTLAIINEKGNRISQTNDDCNTKEYFQTAVDTSHHCVKSVRIWSLSGPYFPAFRLNTERYSVFLCIQSEVGKTRTRKYPNTDTFQAVHWTKINPVHATGLFLYPLKTSDGILMFPWGIERDQWHEMS